MERCRSKKKHLAGGWHLQPHLQPCHPSLWLLLGTYKCSLFMHVDQLGKLHYSEGASAADVKKGFYFAVCSTTLGCVGSANKDNGEGGHDLDNSFCSFVRLTVVYFTRPPYVCQQSNDALQPWLHSLTCRVSRIIFGCFCSMWTDQRSHEPIGYSASGNAGGSATARLVRLCPMLTVGSCYHIGTLCVPIQPALDRATPNMTLLCDSVRFWPRVLWLKGPPRRKLLLPTACLPTIRSPDYVSDSYCTHTQ